MFSKTQLKERLNLTIEKLPVRGSLNFLFSISWAIVVLLAVTVLLAILNKQLVYPNEEVLLAFYPVDFFHLLVGLPVLVVSLLLTRKGRLVGLLCWPGSLIYILYSFVTNLLGVPFGVLFLPYLLLLTLSGYSILGIALSVNYESLADRMSGKIFNKAGGGVLFVLTAIFVINAFSQVITTLLNGETPGTMDIMLWTADLTTISPMCLIGGLLLFQRKPGGLAAVPGLFLAYALLFLGLLPVMIFKAIYAGTRIDFIGFGMMAVFGIVCLVFLANLLKAVVEK